MSSLEAEDALLTLNETFRVGLILALTLFAADRAAGAPGDILLDATSEQAGFQLVTVVEGLDFAWDIAVLPDGNLLLSEYDGRLRLVGKDGTQRIVYAVHETTEQGGLRGITPHPDFRSNEWLYFCYATGTAAENHTRISRARFDGQAVAAFEVIFDARNEARDLAHYGCRLLWVADGTLIATLGDRRHHPAEAQVLGNHYGTIIRINEDGSIPDDNPFTATPGIRPEIWAYGLRNVQGAEFHPKTGEIWASDHGPHGGDEINIIRPGRNYGWPTATFGIDYDGTILTDTPLRPEVQAPLYYWYPSIAPSSIAFYTGSDFPNWRGDLFVGALAARRLIRLELHANHVIHTEDLLIDLDARIRDVTMGADGRMYVLTDTGDGRLLRIDPVKVQ
jgi:glucose/arabinose dehydrogenase